MAQGQPFPWEAVCPPGLDRGVREPNAFRSDWNRPEETATVFVILKPGATPFGPEAPRVFLADRLGKDELPTALAIRERLPCRPVGRLARLDLIEEERGRSAAA